MLGIFPKSFAFNLVKSHGEILVEPHVFRLRREQLLLLPNFQKIEISSFPWKERHRKVLVNEMMLKKELRIYEINYAKEFVLNELPYLPKRVLARILGVSHMWIYRRLHAHGGGGDGRVGEAREMA